MDTLKWFVLYSENFIHVIFMALMISPMTIIQGDNIISHCQQS